MKWIYNDGGKSKYFQDKSNDSVCRAISIATNLDYKYVHDLIDKYIEDEHLDDEYVNNSKPYLAKQISKKLLNDLGWTWIPKMKYGSGCTTHLRENELPNGTLIVSLSKNLSCVKNHVIHDIFNPSRDGNRCVYGYFIKESE
jgi:hypothetical protein